MPQILRTFRQRYPALKLVGKRYTNADRDEYGSFMTKWSQWHQNGWFAEVEVCGEMVNDSYVGAMRVTERGFEYWIGVMLVDAEVPEGFDAVEIPAGDLLVCYLYGRDGTSDLLGAEAHDACVAAWRDRGWNPGGWFIERYNWPRYHIPDEKGNVILDYCAYLLNEEKYDEI